MKSTDNHDDSFKIPIYNPPKDDFLSMVHMALKLRSDVLAQATYKGLNVNEEEALACVPDSLYMFLRLLIGGQSTLEIGDGEDGVDCDDGSEGGVECDGDADHADRKESITLSRVLSIAQDIVYSASGGKSWTPKHVGLASTLHQTTRSKQLVQLFHKAGHIIGYNDVLKLDTALAENTLTKMDLGNGAVIPQI